MVSAYAIPYPGESFERYRLFYEEGRSGPSIASPPAPLTTCMCRRARTWPAISLC